MTFGMFCTVPMPGHWDESCADRMMPCLPIVGALVGAIWWGAAELMSFSGIHTMIAAAVLMLVPFLAAGFIHLDGYMDTSDAVLSRRSYEEMVRILKDPHTGAFAVVMIAVLFTLQFAASYAVVDTGRNLALLAVVPVVSRCGSAMSVLCLKAAPHSSYLSLFKRNTGSAHKVVTCYLAACTFAVAWLIGGITGLVVVASVTLSFIVTMVYVYRCFKGVSGDLTGFSLVISELCGLIVLAVL